MKPLSRNTNNTSPASNHKQPSIFAAPIPRSNSPHRTVSPFRPGHHEQAALEESRYTGIGDIRPSGSGYPGRHTSDQAPSIWASLLPESQRATRGRSASVARTPLATPTSEQPPQLPTTPTLKQHARKRTAEEIHAPPTSEPATKRPRVEPRIKYNLDGLAFAGNAHAFREAALQPPSPLFFSNTSRQRPALPARFSSSEAAARMLSKTRTEDAHVKTVSLARGTITTPGPGMMGMTGSGGSGMSMTPPTSAPQNVSRRSLDRSSMWRSASPDASGFAKDIGGNAAQHLNSIGIIELLEQDERPTFIVDLSDSSNYGPGQLHPLFANSALRSYEGLLDLVVGGTTDSSPGPVNTLEFKSWLLSASVNGESLNVCLPAFSYASMLWTCSTLRKRLRIISGAFQSLAGTVATRAPSIVPIPSAASISAPIVGAEPSDYFGSAAPPPLPKRSSKSPPLDKSAGEPMQSIETHTQQPQSHHMSAGIPTTNGSALLDQTLDAVSTPLLAAPTTYVNRAETPLMATPSAVPNIDWFNSNLSPVDAPCFDWTRLPVSDSMPAHIRFARSIDWANTALGPIEEWGPDLRQMCNLIMASPHPAAMYWGDDYVAIYNEAYIMLAGQKHPALMGQSYSVAWAEIWDDVKDVFANAKHTGEATMKDDDCLFMKRSDYLEETYFSWSIIPMVGGDGSVMGLYNPAFEKTRRKIAERRMLTLREIGERTASARDVKGFWTQVQGALEYNEYDSPFVLLYSVVDETDSDTSSIHSNSVFGARQCLLEGSLGVPRDHPSAPDQFELKAGMEGFGPVFREVMKTDKPALLEVGSKDLPVSLLEGLEWRGFGDPCTSVVVCPIHPTTGESVLGFLVLGVNPRRPYDDDYSLFVQLLSRQLATSLASVVLFEEEIRRGQKAAKLAALDRIELSEQLAARTQEAIDSETKFTRMAEFAPVGMFIAGSDGKIIFANDSWYEISRVPKGQDSADSWMDYVNPEDYKLAQNLWHTLVVDTKSVTGEFRFKAPWEDKSGERGPTWVLFSAYPEKYEDGRLKTVFGSITHISQQKWAEGIQTRKMEEAVELKRQQENFIDITSHEMRNPLSAILQCSDEIASSLTRVRQKGEKNLSEETIANCLDAAQTISLCSQHQKRIVDDILTLSKLDSQLLLVTPVDAQPLTVVQRALKMHEGELQAADIQMKFVVHQTFRDLELDWVRFDPSRVLQVLINLTTNAIKFTTTESKRTITVTIAAATRKPSELSDAPVKYFPTRSKKRDEMEDRDWGEGEKLYIHFSVADTGRGLSPEEKKLLFMRFSQASPRTHVQYGGSGLGLFISRELTELQGGEIGVESEAGKGSIFAFYVAARRSSPPPEDSGIGIASTRQRPPSDSRGKKAAFAMSTQDSKHGKPSSAQDHNAPVVPKDLKKKVLIVEDNLVNQKVLQKQLKNIGTAVYVANHGGEALEKLRQSTYCTEGGTLELGVVLMDQEMPVMDGLTCTKRIREWESKGLVRCHVPIIAVTANARNEQIQTALDAGMDDVVSKPFRIPDLVPKIEELMIRYPMPEGPTGGS